MLTWRVRNMGTESQRATGEKEQEAGKEKLKDALPKPGYVGICRVVIKKKKKNPITVIMSLSLIRYNYWPLRHMAAQVFRQPLSIYTEGSNLPCESRSRASSLVQLLALLVIQRSYCL